jgi:hypothetical protein
MSSCLLSIQSGLNAVNSYVQEEPKAVFSFAKNIIFDWGKELNYLPKSLTIVHPIITATNDLIDFTAVKDSWQKFIDLGLEADKYKSASIFLDFLSDMTYAVALLSSYILSFGGMFEDTLEFVSVSLGMISLSITLYQELNVLYEDGLENQEKALECVNAALGLVRAGIYLTMIGLKTAYKPYFLSCTTLINISKLALHITKNTND